MPFLGADNTRRGRTPSLEATSGAQLWNSRDKEAVAVLLALLVTIIDLDDIDMALPRRLAGKTRLVRPRRQLRSKHAPGGQTLKWRLLKTTPVLSVHAMANIDLPGTLTVRTDSFLGL